jgi:hypothetical protein
VTKYVQARIEWKVLRIERACSLVFWSLGQLEEDAPLPERHLNTNFDGPIGGQISQSSTLTLSRAARGSPIPTAY